MPPDNKNQSQNQSSPELLKALKDLTSLVTQQQQDLLALKQSQSQLSETLKDTQAMRKVLQLQDPSPTGDQEEEQFQVEEWTETNPKALFNAIQKSVLSNVGKIVSQTLTQALEPVQKQLKGLDDKTTTVDRQSTLRDFYATFPGASRRKEELTKIANEIGTTDPYTAYMALVGKDAYDAELHGKSSEDDVNGLHSNSGTSDFEIPQGASPRQIAEIVLKQQSDHPNAEVVSDAEDANPFDPKG